MASTFTWLDYSEHERQRILIAINGMERDTRDELGIGSVRDGFADLFFPGTSTIQTRARYFLFIPWIYAALESRRTPSVTFAARARQDEVRLIDALAAGDASAGIIGIQARGRLQRLPSMIYWQGLGSWGIRLYPGSQDQYYRSLDSYYLAGMRGLRDDDGEPLRGTAFRRWHAGLPPAPADIPRGASLRLTQGEARYLRERIVTSAPRTLLAFLVDRGIPTAAVDFPWEHPQYAEFSERVREALDHSRNFSEVIHGSALLYNLMLAELAGKDQLVESFHQRLAEWQRTLDERRRELASWDRTRFWEIVTSSGASPSSRARLFINQWLEFAISVDTVDGLIADQGARRLIHERERALKGGLARLDCRRALEKWSGEAGTAQLVYRWPVAQRMVDDILAGLAGEVQDA